MINTILNQKRKNLDGVEYLLFNSNNRDKDIIEIEFILNRLLEEIKSIAIQNCNDFQRTLVENNIINHFRKIMDEVSAIRIDEMDMEKPPIIMSICEFIHRDINVKLPLDIIGTSQEHVERELRQYKFAEDLVKRNPVMAKSFIEKNQMDATTNAYRVQDGIRVFAPILKATQNHSKDERINAIKIFVHEMLHVLSVWKKQENDGNEYYFQGVRIINERGIFDDFNEGLNEYFTMKIMSQMYPDEKIECGYKDRVQVIEQIMSKLSKEEQESMFLAYVTGGGCQIMAMCRDKIDQNGKSIFDYFDDYQRNGVGLFGGVSSQNHLEYPKFTETIKGCLQNQKAYSSDFQNMDCL